METNYPAWRAGRAHVVFEKSTTKPKKATVKGEYHEKEIYVKIRAAAIIKKILSLHSVTYKNREK